MKDLKEGKEAKETKKVKQDGIGTAAGEVIGSVGNLPKKTKTFLEDVRAETRRVTWPSARQIRATTVVVIVTVFFFGAYFGILDWVYTRAVGWLLQWGQ